MPRLQTRPYVKPDVDGTADMRATEFLKEGVEFGVARLNDQGAWSSQEFGKYEMAPCWVCDGTGKDSHDGTNCRYCLGAGKSKEWVSTAPTLQVSNANAGAIADMLGLDNSEYSGIITHEQLPAIMKKLIMLNETIKLVLKLIGN